MARQSSTPGASWSVGLLKLFVSLVFLLVFLLSGASSRLHGLVSTLTDNYYLQLSGYLLAFMAMYWAVLLGLDFYSGVVLEHRYGLSNQTTVRWFLRDALQWLLSTLMAIGAFSLLYRAMEGLPDRWWLAAAVGWFVMLVLIGKITPAIVVPLFYRLGPLTDRDLSDRLFALAARCGVPIKRVLEIRLSKETKKANAAVVGLGRDRRILIGDTLLDLCSHDEIEAVFAHELGHVALHHSWKLLGAAAVLSTAGFYLLYLVLGPSATYLGFAGQDDIAAFPLLLLWLTLFALAVRPLQAAGSRSFEKTGRPVHRRSRPEPRGPDLRAGQAHRAQPRRSQAQPPRRSPLLRSSPHRKADRLPPQSRTRGAAVMNPLNACVFPTAARMSFRRSRSWPFGPLRENEKWPRGRS